MGILSPPITHTIPQYANTPTAQRGGHLDPPITQAARVPHLPLPSWPWRPCPAVPAVPLSLLQHMHGQQQRIQLLQQGGKGGSQVGVGGPAFRNQAGVLGQQVWGKGGRGGGGGSDS